MGTTATGTRADVPEESTEHEPDWPWVLRVGAIVVVFGLITIVWSRHVDIPFRDPHGKLFRRKLPGALEILLIFVVVDIVVRSVRRGMTWRTPWETVRNRWTPRRIVLALYALVAYYVVYLCYRNLKSWDVLNTPKDAMLLRWDRWLFFGHSPAVLLHDLLGQDLAARLLTDLYESFSFVVMVALTASIAFSREIRQGVVFVVAAMWAWILGVASYYVIPSLGPFHAAPEEFAGLTRTSIQHTQTAYVEQRTYLLAHPQAHDAFAQISAFASLHCALTCLIWLMARYYGLRTLSWLAGLFLIGTLLATVYLGWHFAVDDAAGLAIAWVSVQLGKLTVFPPRRGSLARPDAT